MWEIIDMKAEAEQESWATCDKGHGHQDSRFVLQLPPHWKGS
ncbi:hypothetical protein [Paraglaciecola sp.]